MRVLVTGFGPFGEVTENPSAVVASEIGACTADEIEVTSETLPVEYEASAARLRELIAEVRPDAVVCLGVAAQRTAVTIERTARRVATSESPDNAGRIGCVAVEDGPDELQTTLPVERLLRRCTDVEPSEDAGGYVCDQLFYQAVRASTEAEVPFAGFIHIPLPSNETPIATIRDRVAALVEAIAEESLSGF